MKIFILWSEQDHTEALRIARQTLGLAEKALAHAADAAHTEVGRLAEAITRAENRSRELDARHKKVSGVAKDL